MMKREIKNIITSVIEKYFIEGKSDKLKSDGYAEIKKLIKRYNLPFSSVSSELNPLIKEVEDKLQQKFFQENLSPLEASIRQGLNSIIKRNNFAITDNQKKIQKIITKTLSGDRDKIEEELQRNLNRIKLEQRHIDTEIFTTKLALDNLKRSADFAGGGVEFLRYAGPSGTVRPFCREHINRIYSMKEVEAMTNNFGQPALVYAGGYNCRHRWVPMIGEAEYVKDSQGNSKKIFKQDGFKETDGKELTIAKFRAKFGSDVELVSGSEFVKSPDAFENGIATEYKRTERTGRRSVYDSLRDAKKQAGNIVVYLDNERYDPKELKLGMENALRMDKTKQINKIIFLNKDGEEIKL